MNEIARNQDSQTSTSMGDITRHLRVHDLQQAVLCADDLIQSIVRNKKRRMGLAMRGNTGDFAQETYIKLIRTKIKVEDWNLDNSTQLAFFVAKIVNGVIADEIKKQQRQKRDYRRNERGYCISDREDQYVESAFRRFELLEDYRSRLEIHDKTLYDIVYLRFWLELTFRELADALDLNEKTVRGKYHQAIAYLKQWHEEDQQRTCSAKW